jgi:hypothetical protein
MIPSKILCSSSDVDSNLTIFEMLENQNCLVDQIVLLEKFGLLGGENEVIK